MNAATTHIGGTASGEFVPVNLGLTMADEGSQSTVQGIVGAVTLIIALPKNTGGPKKNTKGV